MRTRFKTIDITAKFKIDPIQAGYIIYIQLGIITSLSTLIVFPVLVITS
jgi:hypothetical protein